MRELVDRLFASQAATRRLIADAWVPGDRPVPMAHRGVHLCFEIEDLAEVFGRMHDAGYEFEPFQRVTVQGKDVEEGTAVLVALALS